MILLNDFLRIFPRCPADRQQDYCDGFNDALEQSDINTPQRVACFCGQIAHESGELRWVLEQDSGQAYEGRASLGNTQPGDGPRFKGRGFLQLTGRKNYTAFANWSGIDCVNDPDLLLQPQYAWLSCIFYWDTHNINALADQMDVVGVTKIVNGGTNGLAQREAYTQIACQVLGC